MSLDLTTKSLPTKEEFAARGAALIRTQRTATLVVCVLAFVAANIARRIGTSIQEDWPFVGRWLGFAVLSLIMTCGLTLILSLKSRRISSDGLRCPNCRGPLIEELGNVAIATGCCGLCGRRVLAD